MNVKMGMSPAMGLSVCFCPSALCLCFLQQRPLAPALIHWLISTLQGLLFLHRSPLGSLGNLKPSNCLVDRRMQVTLSGFGLWELKYGQTYRTYNERTTDGSDNRWQILHPLAVRRGVKGSLSHLCFPMLTCMGTCRWAFLWG